MKALDTNVLVRFLVRDDEKQAQAVFKPQGREVGPVFAYRPVIIYSEQF